MHLYAGLSSTDEDVVRRFAVTVGVGNVGEQRKRLPHHKSAWVWRANGKAVERVYELLEPWLGERRRARYSELLAERRAYEERRTLGNQNHDSATGRFAFTMGRLPA